MIRFLVAHPAIHRIVHRLTARGEPYTLPDGSIQYPTCLIDRIVWDRLTADPAFVAGIERGEADHAAGRFTRYRVSDGDLIRDDS